MAYDKPIEEVEAPPSVVIEKPEPVRPFLVSPAAPGTNELRGSAGDEADLMSNRPQCWMKQNSRFLIPQTT